MAKDSKFKPGQSGNSQTMFKPGNPHRWNPGVSGNPTGKSRHRAQFEEAFNEALIMEGSPQEAAKLLWEAARSREPWAIQELCRRFAPQTQSLQLIHEVENGTFDYSKLTDEQIKQLEAIMEPACAQPVSPEGGESPAPPA
ncbi:MAG TPA: hypothetical protein VEU11_02640 [Terriglobales bacterium]|nr:hypothetical protein [Terriglobales bacterium]